MAVLAVSKITTLNNHPIWMGKKNIYKRKNHAKKTLWLDETSRIYRGLKFALQLDTRIQVTGKPDPVCEIFWDFFHCEVVYTIYFDYNMEKSCWKLFLMCGSKKLRCCFFTCHLQSKKIFFFDKMFFLSFFLLFDLKSQKIL